MNKKKFITDKDAEIERQRQKEEQLKATKMAAMEPFWQDLNENITAVSKSRETGYINRHGKAF